MRSFFKILRARRDILRNSIRSDAKKNGVKWLLLSLLTVLFLAGDFLFFYRILEYIKTIPFDAGEILIPRLMSIIFLTFLSVLLFSSVIASLSTLFFSGDLDLMFSTPSPVRAVFLSKYLQTLIHSSWMLTLFGAPILIAYGVVYDAGFLYYLFLPALFLPYLIIPSSVGVLFTMYLVFLFPARKAHKVMTILGLFFGVVIIMYLRFLRPEVLIGQEVPEDLIFQFVENLKIPDYPFLPNTWFSQAILFSAKSAYGDMLFYLAVLWAVGILLFLAAFSTAEKIYYRGWADSTVISSKEGSFSGKDGSVLKYLLFFLNKYQRALVTKDFTLMVRDPEQWSQFFLLAALVIVYLFNIRSLPLDTIFLKNLVSVLNIGLTGVVLVAVAGRLVFTSTSIEGKCFWIIQSSPLSPEDFLWEKFWISVIPLVLFSETLVLTSNMFLGVDSFIMQISALTTFLIAVGVTGLSVGIGACYPVFKYENINEVVMSSGGLLFMIYSFFFIVFVISVVSRPVYTHLSGTLLNREVLYFFGEKTICTALVFTASLLCTVVPMKKGIMALESAGQG